MGNHIKTTKTRSIDQNLPVLLTYGIKSNKSTANLQNPTPIQFNIVGFVKSSEAKRNKNISLKNQLILDSSYMLAFSSLHQII